MKKKTLYLNRTVIWGMMIGYIALMLLLLCMDWYLISDYQRENRESGQAALDAYIERTQAAMDSVEGIIREIYLYDLNFDILSTTRDEMRAFSCTYDLMKSLQNRMMTDESLHGAYLYFSGGANSRYQVDLTHIRDEDAGVYNRVLESYINDNSMERQYSCVSVNENPCLAVFYKKGNATLFGMHSVMDVQTSIQERLGKPVETFLVDRYVLLTGNPETADKLHLKQLAQQYTDRYTGRCRDTYIYGRRLENTDLWFFMTVDFNFWSIMNIPQALLLLAALGSVLVVARLLIFMRREFVYPLRQLTQTMNYIRKDKSYKIPDRSFRFHELAEVNETLGMMVYELEKQKTRTYEEIIERQKATMQYLQLQLKPHFYLNGLKTLNALAMENKIELMQELIMNLSEHLRYLLQSERETIPLCKEIDFVKNYVNLQKHVTGRLVECEIESDPQVLRFTVPVLCIQTFVENSIKYARFGSMNVTLKIRVSAVSLSLGEQHFLDLTVADNGQGYDEKILEEINGDPKQGTRSIGINNIKRRCLMIYGDKAEYNFYNDSGAVSELIIPEVENSEYING